RKEVISGSILFHQEFHPAQETILPALHIPPQNHLARSASLQGVLLGPILCEPFHNHIYLYTVFIIENL
ncbi:MAG: hypothetical protein IJC54_00015, partial [Clostridia bacterium]|nr:hypothetical protein [Clostridia bacterium]